MLLILALVSFASTQASLNIKSRTVGDGQHGTARWATHKEIREAYRHIPYTPELWRQKQSLPPSEAQGLVVGCVTAGKKTTALVDTSDIHCLMIGAAGVGKTANFLYPNVEFACASGMSFLCTDTKGDVYRNFAGIAKDCYGYNVSVIDLRNFYTSLHDNSKIWDEELTKSFEDNEKRVEDIISQIKSSLNENDVASSLQRLMNAL